MPVYNFIDFNQFQAQIITFAENLLMPRPRQHRKLNNQPKFKGFKPIGIPAEKTNNIELLFDEYEVIRLLDYENLSQSQAAKEIGVSRPTLTRIYQSARRKIATALTEGLSISFVASPHAYFVKKFFCHDCQSFFESEYEDVSKECPFCHSKNIFEIKPEILHQSIGHQINQGLYFGPRRNRIGNVGNCICSQCGESYTHIPGIPCMEMKCKKCGAVLVREGASHHKQIIEKKNDKKHL